MPQSLSNVLVHIVFSTRDRTPALSAQVREELFPYMVGVLRGCDCPSLQVGGVEDHVHILCRLSRTVTVAQVVEKVKTSSSKWIKSKWPDRRDFGWQAGYGAFSVGQGEEGPVVQYIRDQQARHQAVSFREEYEEILRASGMSWDDRYVWD